MIGATSRNRQTQKSEPLTRDEEYDLILRIKAGDERASRQLIRKNIGLIQEAVKRYGFQVERKALIASGEWAIVKAARKFNLSSGNKFSTYACHVIFSEVRDRFCDEMGITRNTLENLGKISKVSAAFTQELGREPTLEEITARSELSQRQILSAWENKAFAQPRSFNQRFNEDCPEWLDSQIDETADPWDTLEDVEILDTLYQLKDDGHLEDRQVTILIAKHQGYNNREVGEGLEVSRERARQLFKDAAKKIAAFAEGTLQPKTTIPSSTHHRIEPTGEGDQLSPDLPTPEEGREPAIKPIDASRLGGRIGRAIKRIFNQTQEEFINEQGELTNAQKHILVVSRRSNHGTADVAGHRLTPENQRCRQLERTQDTWRGYLGFSQVILSIYLLPLVFVYQSIRGFQSNDRPTNRRSIMSFITTGVTKVFGCGYRKEHPRPPNDFPDPNESLN